MVVHQGDSSDYVAVGAFPGLLDEHIADQVAECFGAVGISANSDQVIEFLE